MRRHININLRELPNSDIYDDLSAPDRWEVGCSIDAKDKIDDIYDKAEDLNALVTMTIGGFTGRISRVKIHGNHILFTVREKDLSGYEEWRCEGNLMACKEIDSRQIDSNPIDGDWSPLSSAPPDQELLLSWFYPVEEKWIYQVSVACSTRGGWWHGRATHWQPLPAPPKQP